MTFKYYNILEGFSYYELFWQINCFTQEVTIIEVAFISNTSFSAKEASGTHRFESGCLRHVYDIAPSITQITTNCLAYDVLQYAIDKCLRFSSILECL